MSDVVVPADWVAERLDEVAVVDVRDAWEFDSIGHVPGAVNVPFDEFRAGDDGEAGMLPGGRVFADLCSAGGLSREDHVVAYDDMHGVFAARFLVTAELYGHDPATLHLLDGDFSSWRLEHETTSDATAVEPTTYEVSDPATTDTPLVDADEVAAVSDRVTTDGEDARTVIVDTREDWEYEEGHIPGAVQLDWRELVDDETRGLKPGAALESVLEARGITRDRRVVLYCNTARRISHTYTVLRHLGYDDLAFYEGSLTEWEAEGRAVSEGEADD